MVRTMTNFSRAGDRALSFRLKTLQSYYRNEEHVWDIGCDHGHLGLSFLNLETVKEINLVDPSGPVIDKLRAAYISTENLKIHHKEGQAVSIDQNSNCIFIAGMGGKEIGQILEHLVPQLNETSRVIISPHRKIIELRSQLNQMPIGLEREEVILEDGQYYQILELKIGGLRKVSLYGDGLWTSETGRKYRDHQLKFFSVHSDEASKLYVAHLSTL